MADTQSSASPLERVAGTLDGVSTEGFELLGNDTRLAILLALWNSKDPSQPMSDFETSELSFSELRDRVGMRHSGQFNYHLGKLEGLFVDQNEEGYTLTHAGTLIVRTIVAGTVTDPPSFEDEPIDHECYLCGAPTVIDYSDRRLKRRCTDCDGTYDAEFYPSGILSAVSQLPAGFRNRTPQELYRQSRASKQYRTRAMFDGICPDCTGKVTPSVCICPDHDTEPGSTCDQCNRAFGIEWVFTCEVCKSTRRVFGWRPIFEDTAVVMFFYEHGVDVLDSESGFPDVVYEAIERTEVRSEDPLELLVTVELDGDRLSVTLDETATVIDVTEDPE